MPSQFSSTALPFISVVWRSLTSKEAKGNHLLHIPALQARYRGTDVLLGFDKELLKSAFEYKTEKMQCRLSVQQVVSGDSFLENIMLEGNFERMSKNSISATFTNFISWNELEWPKTWEIMLYQLGSQKPRAYHQQEQSART